MNRLIYTTLVLAAAPLLAQPGRSGEWMNAGNDAQRSSWVRADGKISAASIQKGGFQLVWKMKFDAAPTQPVLLDRIIGYKGFKTLAFVGTASDKVFTVDTDLARLEWTQQLPSAPAKPSKSGCAAGITSALARPTTPGFGNPNMMGGFGGRGGPAKSSVGDPDQGATTLALRPPQRNFPIPGPAKETPGASSARPRPNRPQIADGPFSRGITPVYAIASDGNLHIINVQNGAAVGEQYKFLPANSNPSGLLVIQNVAYASTDGTCGEGGVWAVDTNSAEAHGWSSKTGVAGIAMGPDGTVYAATRGGELAALEPVTLKEKTVARVSGAEFVSSPILFEQSGKAMLAAASKDGRVFLADASSLDAASPAPAKVAGPLATWQDAAGTRWLLTTGPASVTAWKVLNNTVEQAWTSRELRTPLAPVIINGVVFTGSAGTKSSPAVVYALDAATGKELWNSGKSAVSFATNTSALSAGGGQVYLATQDGTLHAFGFPMEH